MPLTYSTDATRRRIRITMSDPISLDDLTAAADRQWRDGTWQYGMLIDLRRVTQAWPAEDIRAFSAHMERLAAQYGPRGPVAVVTRTANLIGATTVYTEGDGPRERQLETFWDLDEADAWLDQVTEPR